MQNVKIHVTVRHQLEVIKESALSASKWPYASVEKKEKGKFAKKTECLIWGSNP